MCVCPLFDVELWNVRDRVERSLPRTNNSVEDWHRAFDQRINMTHPTTSKLIRKIVVEQSSNEILWKKLDVAMNNQSPGRSMLK